jgi:hypothetical protein
MRVMQNVNNPRLLALDRIPGLVMVLMAVDHASIIYNSGRLALDSAATYLLGTPLPLDQFLTRWITHLATPTFVFLAGAALALSCHKRTAGTAMLAMAWLHRLSDMTLLIIASMWLLIGEALTTLWWVRRKAIPPCLWRSRWPYSIVTSCPLSIRYYQGIPGGKGFRQSRRHLGSGKQGDKENDETPCKHGG